MFKKRQKQKLSLAERSPGIRAWFGTAFGRLLLDGEQCAVARALEGYRGQRIVQLSPLSNVVRQNQSVFRRVWRVHCRQFIDSGEQVSLVSEFENLPFEDSSIDIVIVHHGLEFSPTSQQLLKEVARITNCGGHVVIVAFNPVSLNGLHTAFMRMFKQNSVWHRKRLSINRLKDWLKFIDLSLVEIQYLFHDLPINNATYLKYTTRVFSFFSRMNLPFGASYCVVARKDTLGMHKPTPLWQRDMIRSALTGAKPAQPIRSASRNDPKVQGKL